MRHVADLRLDWDMLYLGRRPRNATYDVRVENSTLYWAASSYSTRAYLLTQSGARKLLAPNPLQKLMALDEYIPIMTDNYFKPEWLAQFSPRNVRALAADPLLVCSHANFTCLNWAIMT